MRGMHACPHRPAAAELLPLLRRVARTEGGALPPPAAGRRDLEDQASMGRQ